jgi:hypothetical protein
LLLDMPRPRKLNITNGTRFNRLVALEDGYAYNDKIRVRCDCGVEKTAKVGHLMKGDSKSCGCLRKESTHKANLARTRHGHNMRATKGTTSPTYRTWISLNSRCRYDYDVSWRWYGGRPEEEGGPVRVCEHIRFGQEGAFERFLALLGPRPDGMTIDRIDPLLHYSCGQCRECQANGWNLNMRWATAKEQIAGRRNLGRYGRKAA